LCLQPVEQGACDTCKSCELIRAGSHPDFRLLASEDDKAIGIDAIRAAARFLVSTPAIGLHRVLLIDPAERLTLAAWNAFLKSLEEPAPGTLVLLVAAQGYPLPATIRSRCLRLKLASPTEEEAAAWLREALATQPAGQPRDDVAQLLELFPGQPLRALDAAGDDALAARIALRDFFASQAQRDEPCSGRDLLRVAEVARRLPADGLLDTVDALLHRWLRDRDAVTLRSVTSRRVFVALEQLAGLRRAKRSGQNPNADLLRVMAARALLAPFAAGEGVAQAH
jgi:DNA polymerase-3 subunit delta'